MLVDHFWDERETLSNVASAKSLDRGDFAQGVYQATIRRNPDRIQVMLTRNGNVWGIPIQMTKGITLSSQSNQIEIAYQIDGIPEGQQLHFGVEFNFAGMPDGQDDRYFENNFGEKLGGLGSSLDLRAMNGLRLVDQWLGLKVDLQLSSNSNIWAFPIRTVSQSESGFELVHQSVVVQPHWIIRGDSTGRWTTKITLGLESLKSEELSDRDSVVAVS